MNPDAAPGNDLAVEVDASCLDAVAGLLVGDAAAVAEVYRRFVDRLVQRADRHIPDRLRGKVLAESVVHSVMGHLLTLGPTARERLARYRIDTWAQLYGLLAQMTVFRCLNRVRALRASRRGPDAAGPLGPADPADVSPSPEDELAYAEMITRLLDPFQPVELEVLQLRMAGRSTPQIAAELNLTTTVVKSTVRRLQRRLERLLSEEEDR